MIKLGYKLMSEEHGPKALVRNTQKAEDAGFDFAAISDHFFPWIEEQGHSPLAWTVLGGCAQATSRIGLMTSVTCPHMRYHPAIIAQGTATMALMSDDRFTLGIGSGERLNEHVVGQGWPGLGVRYQRMVESLEIIQGLLEGTMTSYHGKYLQLDQAKLYDRPEKKPEVIVAAGGPRAARLAGRKGDGLMTVEPRAELVEAYRSKGGEGPRYCEVAMCYGADEAEAVTTAHRYARWTQTGWPVLIELPDTAGFAGASKFIPPEEIEKAIPCGPSLEKHMAQIDKFVAAGHDHIILLQIGPDQDSFISFFEKELAPALRARYGG